jgi:hypothetical protein
MSEWLYEGQHGFRPGYSCESHVVAVCQDITDSLDDRVRTDAKITDYTGQQRFCPKRKRSVSDLFLDAEFKLKGKGKAIPLHALTGPEGSRRFKLLDFKIIGT